MRDDEGAGAVLALALVGATVVVAVALLGLGGALSVRQQLIGASDAAALAAADTASGATVGEPCANASRVAAAVGARLSGCRLDGLIATVEVSGAVGVLPFSARSTAGPPP